MYDTEVVNILELFAERRGERWRRTRDDRTSGTASPAAIRSTEKFGGITCLSLPGLIALPDDTEAHLAGRQRSVPHARDGHAFAILYTLGLGDR